jgi:peroxiredoxin
MKTWTDRLRRVVTLDLILWMLVAGFVGYRMWPQVAAAFALGGPIDLSPDFALTTLEGESVTLDSLRGEVVLVNFWATWCPPCRVEMPGFERVYRDRRDDGFTIVAISTDRGGVDAVRDFLETRDLTFPVAMADAGMVRDFGDLRALPTSFLIDRQGRVRHEVSGIFAEPALRRAVDRLLAESPDQAAEVTS